MFPPSFGEKNEKLNSNMSFGGRFQRRKKTPDPNGNSQRENPLTSHKEKIKKKHGRENFKEKKLPLKKRENTLNKQKEK
jgi:hypothetical protein